MNSLVSYEWLKHYVNLKGVSPDEFARRISLSGPAVEKIIPQGRDLEKIVVGQIKEIKPHPNADKLRLVMVDVGLSSQLQAPGSKKSVHLHIVCGGSNLEKDQWVAVALIGAKVRWHGAGDLIELQPAEIRGQKSEGMICAASEIGLGEAFPHEEKEILDLGKEFKWNVGAGSPRPGRENCAPTPGAPLADVLGLSDDVVMDIEVTSNRVDAMGMVGLAREASAILNKKMIWKAPKSAGAGSSRQGRGNRAPTKVLSVKVDAKKLCPRYMAVKIDGLKVGPSPWWMKKRLISAGLRPINNIVDITNYVLLEYAQPMHAFDAEILTGAIHVRLAQKNEKIKALDGKDYALDDSMLIVADEEKPIAIAGVMGGENTGVTQSTNSVVFEAATFDPVSVRRTARKLNLQSDSQLRFEKGLSTQAPPEALARAIELTLELAGGEVVSPLVDVEAEKYKHQTFSISSDEIRSLMGVEIKTVDMVGILRRLGFSIATSGKTIKAKVPWWRDHDIELARDLVEEVARVYGYGNIPAVVPMDLAPRPMAAELVWEDRIRDVAKGAGLTETYSYSFVSKELLEKAGYDSTSMLHVQNPLTSDLEIMRTTLLPSLLQVAAENVEREPNLRFFEISNVYYPKNRVSSTKRGTSSDWTDLPDEQPELGALFLGGDDAWKIAKGFVEHLLHEMGIEDVSWKRLATDEFWHPGRTAQAFKDQELMATVGEVSPKIARNFKLESRVALLDMPLKSVVKFATTARHYIPLSPFPSAKRDLAVLVDRRVEFDDMAREIKRIDPLITNVEWFDTYRGKNLQENQKSVAMHLEFSSPERTLESKEVDGFMENAVLILKEKFKAEIRG
ncbi:MAG: phenylalanine--tRNA ligase subunit beta [Patescibacteria group bacterium]